MLKYLLASKADSNEPSNVKYIVAFSAVLYNLILSGDCNRLLCFTAAHFVYTYVTGDYVSLRNSIMIALLINSVMSVYILTLLMIVELLKKLTFHNV